MKRTSNIDTVQTIRKRNDLIEWLANEIKTADPQMEVANGYLEVFDAAIDEFRIAGCYADLERHGLWEDQLNCIFEALAETPGMQICGAMVKRIPAFIFARGMQDNSEVYVDYLFSLMLESLDLTHLVSVKRKGDMVRVRSKDAFVAKYGIAIDVTAACLHDSIALR